MMRIGLHVRVAGGYAKAVEHAKAAGCTALQVFSTNPRTYRPTRDRRAGARSLRRSCGARRVSIRAPSIRRISSTSPATIQRSTAGRCGLLRDDLAAAARGGMRFVNTHLGLVRHARPQRRVRGDLPRAGDGARRTSSPASFSCWKTRPAPATLPAERSKSSARSSERCRSSAARRLSGYRARVGRGL